MTFKKIYISIFIAFSALVVGNAQELIDSSLVQFSGMVLDGSDDNLYPIPFANILIKNDARGTYSEMNGFFSLVAKKGDVVSFSAIGYKNVDFVIPDSLEDSRYSIVQLMTPDTINLPETIVFPWPSRDHFRLEFLAMDVKDEMQQRAIENLAQKSLRKMIEEVPYDGDENADYYLRKEAQSYYYVGQIPPMNIFSPVAWKQFFDAWKRGDFKKKKEGDK